MQNGELRQGKYGWNSLTKVGRALEESGWESDMKIQACFTGK